MNHRVFMIAQGSTPTLELELPFEAPVAAVAYATFTQEDEPVLEYAYNSSPTAAIKAGGKLIFDADDRSVLLLSMTQADTLKLVNGDVELQVRIRTNDGADTFYPIPGGVVQARKGGVI